MATGRVDHLVPSPPFSFLIYGAEGEQGRGRTMTRRLGGRGLDLLRDELSGRDHAIVRQVAELRLMSARQIEAIHFTLADHASLTTAARSCRRVLERLVRDRLLIRLDRRVGGIRAGSASFIYTLGPVGQRLIQTIDGEHDEPRRRFREPSSPYVAHTLAISQLVVDLTEENRDGQHELLGLQAEPTCWRVFMSGLAVQTIVKPDLFVALGVGEFEQRWFVEIDLGTEHLPTLLRKCQTYERYYRSGIEQDQHGVFPRVLWAMHDDVRAKRLRLAIEQSSSLTDELFEVTSIENAVEVMRGGQR